jgi:uncharacterized YccA/Bax inhibitor family protein
MAYKSSNPALNTNTFRQLAHVEGDTMTLDGVAFKSMALLVLCFGGGYLGWQLATQQSQYIGLILIGAFLVSLVLSLVTIFKKTAAPITAPLYAIAEGVLLGVISQAFEAEFEGLVLQAILLTGCIFMAMLLLYLSRIIKVTENFKLGIMAATGGIALFYLASLIFGLFGVELPLIASTSVWGIGFSVIVVIIASLNLVVDFDFIEKGVEAKAPKYMEWYASFGLLVTLVWLYLELLRLLAKSRR